MREVLFVNETKEKKPKPIALTHFKGNHGWCSVKSLPIDPLPGAEKVVYLGSCCQDGDMFAVYRRGFITTYKGILNDGVY